MESLCLLDDFWRLDKQVGTLVTTMVVASSFAGVEKPRSTYEA